MIFKGLSKSQTIMVPIGAALLLFPLIPMPRPLSLTGHPWKVELAVFLLLSVVLTLIAFQRYRPNMPDGLRMIRMPLTFIVVWSALSVIWADSAWSVFHHTAVWTAYLFCFLIFVSFASEKSGLRFLITAAAFACSVLGLLTLFGYSQVLLNPEYENAFRVTYAKYSEVLATVTPFFFVLACGTRRRRNLFSVIAFICFAAVVVSLSRGSFLAAVAGIIAAFVLMLIYLRKRTVLIRAGVLAVGLAAVFGITQLASVSDVTETTLVERFRSQKGYQTASNDIRRLLLGVSFSMIRANPLIGIGADNFGIELNKYRAKYAEANPANPSLSAGEELVLERAHNEYLQFFSELGIVGLGSLALLLIASGLAFVRRITTAGDVTDRTIRIAAASGIIAFLASSAVSSFSFRAIQNGLVFFVLLAIAVAPRVRRRVETGEQTLAGVIPALMFSLLASALFASQAIGSFFVMAAEKNENLENAVALYQTSRLFDGSSASADMSQAMRLFREKKPGEAIPFYRSAIDKGAGVVTVYHFLAFSNSLVGNFEESETVMRECAGVFPKSVYAHSYLAYFLQKNGKTDESKRELETARKLDEKAANSWDMIIRKGTLQTSIEARTRKDLIAPSDLNPQSVVLAFLADEKRNSPLEKSDK